MIDLDRESHSEPGLLGRIRQFFSKFSRPRQDAANRSTADLLAEHVAAMNTNVAPSSGRKRNVRVDSPPTPPNVPAWCVPLESDGRDSKKRGKKKDVGEKRDAPKDEPADLINRSLNT